MKQTQNDNVVAIIGAGPVGIAAAAQLLQKGLTPIVLEKGNSAGRAIQEWGHVRVFTPWQLMTDPSVTTLLDDAGWTQPDAESVPTGQEFVDQYLIPATSITLLKDHINFGAEVIAVSKRGLSKSVSRGRDNAPFSVHYVTADGVRHVLEAGAVIDASGTWSNPNPIGADGLPVPGEEEAKTHIFHAIPDTLGADRKLYDGKSTLVLGGGHSATNVVLDLLQLRRGNPSTQIFWGLRHNTMEKLLSSVGLNKELPERAALGTAAKEAIDAGSLELLAPMRVERITKADGKLNVSLMVAGQPREISVDRIVVNTGFSADLDILRELRLDLDDVVESPRLLAPMIDPNLHSCGSVPAHGVEELSHPDKNFFIVGMKSYGRAPTFLMRTGYAQVHSITDSLAGVVTEMPLEQIAPACCIGEDGAEFNCGGKLEADPDPARIYGAPQQQASSCCGSEDSSPDSASNYSPAQENAAGCCGSSGKSENAATVSSGCCGSSQEPEAEAKQANCCT
ncbi:MULTISPECIES: NAD(P)-binding domain-containing protein [unclassified Phaeobacter]|uniref:NAD(P)-binding domain-containing protein n=1 Tax=unclassified Phaeobacter TaxID=2621772 RepID=UPI003A8759B4